MHIRKIIVLLAVFLLSSCTLRDDVPRTDETTLGEIFGSLEIQKDRLSVHQTDIVGDATVDSVEMARIMPCTAVVVHFVTVSAVPSSDEDHMLKVTPEWLYDTRTMKKTTHSFNICANEGVEAFLSAHTRLLGGALYTNAGLIELALSLQEPRFHTEGAALILRGINPDVENLPENENAMVEIKYREGRLLEIHFRHEYDFPSTKQQSNYISGTHYYFKEGPITDFPPLKDFSP